MFEQELEILLSNFAVVGTMILIATGLFVYLLCKGFAKIIAAVIGQKLEFYPPQTQDQDFLAISDQLGDIRRRQQELKERIHKLEDDSVDKGVNE